MGKYQLGFIPTRVHPEMVDFGFRQGPSEFSTAGIARAMLRIENERERRWGPKMPFVDGH